MESMTLHALGCTARGSTEWPLLQERIPSGSLQKSIHRKAGGNRRLGQRKKKLNLPLRLNARHWRFWLLLSCGQHVEEILWDICCFYICLLDVLGNCMPSCKFARWSIESWQLTAAPQLRWNSCLISVWLVRERLSSLDSTAHMWLASCSSDVFSAGQYRAFLL